MADDTISIFEPRNNGFEGGKYLERGQVGACGLDICLVSRFA